MTRPGAELVGGSGLQWGRGLSAAEMREGAPRPRAPGPASMGPRPFSRGNPCGEAKALPRATRASMGPRPFSRGNRQLHGVHARFFYRFNGAAAFQPRKSAPRRWLGRKPGRLQWGRGLSAAEIERRAADSTPNIIASMGPRPFSRGNCEPAASPAASMACFNGAAAFQPRKCPGPRSLCRRSAPASMGPRPFSRGNK